MACAALRPSRTPRPLTDPVHLAQSGDEAAFERLYREHAGRVYGLCLRMTADASRAADLTQDVFVRAWERLDSFRGESAFGTWLHRLAVNVVLMDQRSRGRRPERPFAEGEEDAVLGRGGETRPALRLDLEAAVAALPPGARQVLVLHDIEGYEHSEIAAMVGIAEGTSRAHLFRARRLVREALGR